jgi:hypothetical protein
MAARTLSPPRRIASGRGLRSSAVMRRGWVLCGAVLVVGCGAPEAASGAGGQGAAGAGAGGAGAGGGASGCAAVPGCDAAKHGDDTVASVPNEAGFVTTIVAANGDVHVFTWVVAGGATQLTYQHPDGTLDGPVTVPGAMASAAAASDGSYYVYGAATGDFTVKSYEGTTSFKCNDHAGCDPTKVLGFLSCAKGSCCDAHDACIAENCRGPDDTCNVAKGLFSSKLSQACRECHQGAVACFVNPTAWGKSACCASGTCGKVTQCFIDGKAETDACACWDKGIDSREPCSGKPACADALEVCGAEGGAPCCSAKHSGSDMDMLCQPKEGMLRCCRPLHAKCGGLVEEGTGCCETLSPDKFYSCADGANGVECCRDWNDGCEPGADDECCAPAGQKVVCENFGGGIAPSLFRCCNPIGTACDGQGDHCCFANGDNDAKTQTLCNGGKCCNHMGLQCSAEGQCCTGLSCKIQEGENKGTCQP